MSIRKITKMSKMTDRAQESLRVLMAKNGEELRQDFHKISYEIAGITQSLESALFRIKSIFFILILLFVMAGFTAFISCHIAGVSDYDRGNIARIDGDVTKLRHEVYDTFQTEYNRGINDGLQGRK